MVKETIDNETQEEVHQLFKKIWDEQEDDEGNCYCFETGRTLYWRSYRNTSNCYHHVLEQGKTKFPQYKKIKKNIIIIHPDIHLMVHQDIDKTPNIKEYRKYLLSLHYKNEL